MSAVVWTFLIGLGTGGMAAWIILSLNTVAANPAHTSSERHEGWTVGSIAARIERERLEANRHGHIGTHAQCG